MKSWIRALSFLAVVSPFAPAQNIVWREGFETGIAQWTATGLWRAQTTAGACATAAVPFPEGNGAAWYGNPATCSIDDGQSNNGGLLMNDWVTLPTGFASLNLYFKSYVDSEYCWGFWDRHELSLSTNLGTTGFTLLLCDVNGPAATLHTWHERRVNLTAYAGQQVKLRFQFVSGDNAKQAGLGWVIDDVRIIAEPGQPMCPSANVPSGCPCDIALGVGGGCFNALGKSATLISSGTASVAADTLAFTAAEMMPGTAGTLFQGTGTPAAITIFGDGILCVTGSLVRLGTQFGPSGAVDWPLASLGTISAAGFVPPSGGTFYYQVMYRDATPGFCTSATFNLTSAQRVNWNP
jgi:hypothetical protein